MSLDPLRNGSCGKAWEFFETISRIPRPSGHEERIRDWLLDEASQHPWRSFVDSAGNALLQIPGRGALAQAPTVILQGHLDMVCEKNESIVHDFLKDPISPQIRDDGWISADGTTLGADNGVAPALALAVAMDPSIPDRIPLELLFTVDEETGLTGARNLDPSPIRGKMLLNLDSGTDAYFVSGCSGGIRLESLFPLKAGKPQETATTLRLTGLRGGHSGTDILGNRENALILCGRMLGKWIEATPNAEICSIRAGNKENAIPREATVTVAGDHRDRLESISGQILPAILNHEPEARIEIEADHTSSVRIPICAIDFICRFPNGVWKMETHTPDLVRTSCSLGVAKMLDNALLLNAHGRSAATEDRADIRKRIEAMATGLGATFQSSGEYPGWSPNPNSTLLRHAAAAYRRIYGSDPGARGIHAGLEAGIIGARIGTDELLAFGPRMEDNHSPLERLRIDSFENVYAFLLEFVSKPTMTKGPSR
jgi:dipeptidase D